MTDNKQSSPRANQNPEKDAAGQYVQSKQGEHNNGVSSATPPATTGTDDATFKNKAREQGEYGGD